MPDRLFKFALIPVLLFGIGVALLVDHSDRPTSAVQCFEDEVIVWNGTSHGTCIPVDDLFENPYEDGANQPRLGTKETK